MNDKTLVKRAKNGDPEAFTTLMEQNKAAMYKTAISILHNDADAADAMQDAILSCWKNIRELKNERHFKTWLTRVLINSCKDLIKKNSRITYVESYDGLEKGSDSEMYERNVRECFDGLSENYRLIMTLYYTQGLTIKEIAEKLDMNENTVKTRLSRGRTEFKELYTSKEAAL